MRIPVIGETIEECADCKGEGENGHDGYGYVYVCERCDGHGRVWRERASYATMRGYRE